MLIQCQEWLAEVLLCLFFQLRADRRREGPSAHLAVRLSLSISINMLCIMEMFWLLCVLMELNPQLPVVRAERKLCVCARLTHSCSHRGPAIMGPEYRGRMKPRDTLPSLKQHTNCFFPSSWPWTCVSSPLTKYADTSGMCFSCECVICCVVYRLA